MCNFLSTSLLSSSIFPTVRMWGIIFANRVSFCYFIYYILSRDAEIALFTSNINCTLKYNYWNNYFSVSQTQNDGLSLWEEFGCPAKKLIVGVPFYAHVYQLHPNVTNFSPGACIVKRNVEGGMNYYQVYLLIVN